MEEQYPSSITHHAELQTSADGKLKTLHTWENPINDVAWWLGLFYSLFLVRPQSALAMLCCYLGSGTRNKLLLLLYSQSGPSCPYSIYLSLCDCVPVYWMSSAPLISSLHAYMCCNNLKGGRFSVKALYLADIATQFRWYCPRLLTDMAVSCTLFASFRAQKIVLFKLEKQRGHDVHLSKHRKRSLPTKEVWIHTSKCLSEFLFPNSIIVYLCYSVGHLNCPSCLTDMLFWTGCSAALSILSSETVGTPQLVASFGTSGTVLSRCYSPKAGVFPAKGNSLL